MLPEKTKHQPDAIEKHFCEPFEKLPRHPMNEDSTKMLFELLMIPKGKDFPDKKPFLMQLIEKRMEYCFTFKMEDLRAIFLMMYVSESPGRAVMYLTYLQYWCKQNNVRELDLEILCGKVFPFGFPDPEDLSKLWYSIKVDGKRTTNLLDHAAASQSIQLEKEQAPSI